MELYKDKNWLETRYVHERKSTRQIGKECLVDKSTIRRHLVKFSIPLREPPKEKQKKPRRKLGNTVHNQGENSPFWKGFGQISACWWSRFISGANKRNIKVEVTIEEAWNLFLKQNSKCALSGQVLSFPIKQRLTQFATASIDRKDSSKGYTIDNIQWTHKTINMFKNNMSDRDFITLCKMVSEYNK